MESAQTLSASPRPASRATLFGHPKGMFLVAGTEAWERFSFYGMLGLLVLFLTASTAEGGFGWSEPEALKLYGLYMALSFIGPTIGGWLAGRYLGERRCILYGGLIVAAGHFLLGGPAWLPAFIGSWSGVPVQAIIESANIPRGLLLPGAPAWEALHASLVAAGGDSGQLPWVTAAYRATTLSFFAGLLLIISGTAFIKPTITSIVQQLYPDGDGRRSAAFTFFFAAIYLGSFSASFVSGTLGEKLGWHYGLTAAGVGMLIGMLVYLWKQQAYLGDIGRLPPNRDTSAGFRGDALDRQQRDRLWLVLVTGLFAVVYAVAFYQKGGLIHLITREATDRMLWGFSIPATWFLTVSTGTFILLSPFAGALWQRLDAVGRNPHFLTKLAAGLGVIALGYVFLLGSAAERAASGELGSPLWIVATYVCFGISDLLFWPAQLAAVSRLAPPRLVPLAVGCWYLVFGIGTWLAGYVGAAAYVVGETEIFTAVLVSCVVAGSLLFLLKSRLSALMHGVTAN